MQTLARGYALPRLVRPHEVCGTDEPERGADRLVSLLDERHGVGCSGNGGTPQMAVAQGGSGGVGIRELLPWVLAEPPVIHVPL